MPVVELVLHRERIENKEIEHRKSEKQALNTCIFSRKGRPHQIYSNTAAPLLKKAGMPGTKNIDFSSCSGTRGSVIPLDL